MQACIPFGPNNNFYVFQKNFRTFMCAETLAQISTEANNLGDVKGFNRSDDTDSFSQSLTLIVNSLIKKDCSENLTRKSLK